MPVINIYQAKTQLSGLVDQALAGQEIIIARQGRPQVKLVPLDAQRSPRVFGELRGSVTFPDDFNDPDPEIDQLFGG